MLRAKIQLRDANGRLSGTQELSSAAEDCDALDSAVGLAISIAIDPLLLRRTPPDEPPTSAAPSPVVPPAPVAARPSVIPKTMPSSVRAGPSLGVSLGALGSLGSAPSFAVGFTAQLRVRWQHASRGLSAGLEARADLPASGVTSGTLGVQTSLVVGTLVPCFHYRMLVSCALASFGALRGEGVGIDRPRQDTSFFAGAGARLGVEFAVWRFLSLGLHLDLLGNITRPVLTVDGKAVWTTPPVSGALGATVRGHFL